jgi:enoyl-CoA hydratase
MTYVQYEVSGQVGILTINRPEALNALNHAVLIELDLVLDQIDLETTRCLVITGSGEKAFIAGADVAEMSSMDEDQARVFG